MQLDDRCGQLRSVVASKSMTRFLKVRWVNQGVSIWLLAHTVSRAWARCAMLGQSVTASRYVDWMLHCWSAVVGRSISQFLTVHWVNGSCVHLVASPYSESYVGQMLQC